MASEKEYRMSLRLKRILQVIRRFRKIVTTREVAAKAELTTSGTSQSLKALAIHGYVKCEGGEGGGKKWRIAKE